jgi:quercetin dioxygenase-like cupin family protein
MELIPADDAPIPLNESAAVSGVVRLRRLVGRAQTDELDAYLVRFEAGGRNLLHTHSFDQVLYILEGEGIVATVGERLRVRPGDVVVVPAGEEHWHGATDDLAMTHLALGAPGTTDVVDGERYTPPN